MKFVFFTTTSKISQLPQILLIFFDFAIKRKKRYIFYFSIKKIRKINEKTYFSGQLRHVFMCEFRVKSIETERTMTRMVIIRWIGNLDGKYS